MPSVSRLDRRDPEAILDLGVSLDAVQVGMTPEVLLRLIRNLRKRSHHLVPIEGGEEPTGGFPLGLREGGRDGAQSGGDIETLEDDEVIPF